MTIYEQIEAQLSNTPDGMTASELAKQLGISKKAVNSILYEQSGKTFAIMKDGPPPTWKVRRRHDTGIIGLSKSLTRHSGASPNFEIHAKTERAKACAMCGMDSKKHFCSDRCRGRACKIEAMNVFETISIHKFDELIRFVVEQPAAQIDQYLVDCGSYQCSEILKDGISFVQLWEANHRDISKTVDFLREHFESCTIEEKGVRNISSSMMVALANISERYHGEVIEALEDVGLTVTERDVVECNVLIGLDGLSRAARKQIENLIVRRLMLESDISRREIDQFTLNYVGISTELSEELSLQSKFTLTGFEQYGRQKIRACSPNLRADFDDLLLALAVHPILPTVSIVENLTVWYPRVFVDAKKLYLRRLLHAMNDYSSLHSSVDFERSRRVATLLLHYVNGGTLEMVGREIGVTGESARRQLNPVVAQCDARNIRGLRDLAMASVRNNKEQESGSRAHKLETISSYIRLHPGITIEEILSVFSEKEIVNLACSRHAALILDGLNDVSDIEKPDRQDIIDSLKAASLLSFPLTGVAYDQLIADGFVKGVSRMRIMQVYGTWREACLRAEVEAGEPIKNINYVRKYGFDELIRVVCQFLIDDDKAGRTGGMHSYGPWRDSQEFSDALPSAGTIQNHVGRSWKTVKRLALLELRNSWSKLDSEGDEERTDD